MSSLALVLLLGACGGSGSSKANPASPPTAAPSGTPTTTHIAKTAANEPSESAKMVCAPEAVKDISEVLGVKPTKVSTPTWKDHDYSCDYVYAGGATMTLSVKELSSVDETTAYFNELAQKLGKKGNLQIAQGAFSTTGGSSVTRKDFKVLLVDTSKLPASFAGDTRENDAINVAFTVMNCWTGE